MKKKFTVKNSLKKAMSLLLLSLSTLLLNSCDCDRPDPATLGGLITDRETNQPVNGATVSVNKNNLSIVTDADGTYEFPKIGAGEYTVTVSHPDYETFSQSVRVNVDDVTWDMQIAMKKFTFTGTVRDSKTNEPVQGVSVKLSTGLEKTTGQDGTYAFDNLRKGEVTIIFSKEGYKDRTEAVTLPDVTSLTTALEPYLSTLTGTVTDSRTGQAIAGVSVSNGDGATVATNGEGVYSFPDLRKTSYKISASKEGYKDKPATDVTVDITQESNTYNFTIDPLVTGLSGTVTNAQTGAALAGVTVTLSPGGYSQTTGADGAYTFTGLTQTSYTLGASLAGYQTFSQNITVNPAVQAHTQNIQLSPITTSLTGTVTNAQTGAALSGVTVTLSPGNLTATTNSGGAYSFNGLTGTSYTLGASLAGYQTFSQNITVNLAIPSNTQNIQLTPATKTLMGTVTNAQTGAALSGVTVTLTPGNLTYTTGANGTYTFNGLTGTSYQISASATGYDNYGPLAVSTPNTNNTHNIQMTATPVTKTLSGTVTSSGNGLSGVTVTLSPGNLTTTTGTGGGYSFSGLTGTSYSITATKSGYTTYGPYTVSTPNTINTYNFSMTVATKTLSGTVTSSGSGLSGVTVTLSPGGYTYTTGSGGGYQFSGLTGTSYSISASKSGYNSYGPYTVSTPNTINTYNIVMTPNVSSSLVPDGIYSASGTPSALSSPGAATWISLIANIEGYFGISNFGNKGDDEIVICKYTNGKIMIDGTTELGTAVGNANIGAYFRACTINGNYIIMYDPYEVIYNSSTKTLDFSGTINGRPVLVGIVALNKTTGAFEGLFTDLYANLKFKLITPLSPPQISDNTVITADDIKKYKVRMASILEMTNNTVGSSVEKHIIGKESLKVFKLK